MRLRQANLEFSFALKRRGMDLGIRETLLVVILKKYLEYLIG